MDPEKPSQFLCLESAGSALVQDYLSVFQQGELLLQRFVLGGSSNPMIAAPVRDFPAPDSPTTPKTSPALISKLTSSTATKVPDVWGNQHEGFELEQAAFQQGILINVALD